MKRSELLLMILQVPIDFLMLVMAAITAYQLRFSEWAVALKPVLFDFTLLEFLDDVTPMLLGWIIIFAISGLYSIDPNRKFSKDITRIFLACSTGLAAIALYILFSQQPFDSRFLVAAGWGCAILYVIVGRLFMRGIKGLLYRAGVGLRRVVIIGTADVAQVIAQTLEKRRELGFSVVGMEARFSEKSARTIEALMPDEIIFTNPRAREEETLKAIDFCNERHIVFKYSADLFATYAANMAVHPVAGVPIVEVKRTSLEGWGRVAKRLFDIVMSILCIILVSPIMLLTVIAILIETGTPVIYKNERVGLRGAHFFVLKFRSMYQKDSTGAQFGSDGADAEAREAELIKKQSIKEGPVYKIKNDPRVTPVGRFIRATSIDELPQFFNVLAGSMSIVGPRPHQPREVAQYQKHHKKVFTLKPGITGLAQISGRSDLSFEDEVRLDVLYIEKWSLMTDIIIFLKTPFVLFKKRKAL